MRNPKNILVTGGCGFIGSNFIRYLFEKPDFSGRILNVDKLTYAGNKENLHDIESKHLGERYFFSQKDICETMQIVELLSQYQIDTVVHFAAESHVDRSILGPQEFVTSNVMGTFSMLEAARKVWTTADGKLFHHVGTDEVFGSAEDTERFIETTRYDPRSPYSASKAASDHFVKAYHHTYGLPVTVSNCSNNYGPYQNSEKLIPLLIKNMLARAPLPIYGDGKNIRDWIFVDDHNEAVWLIMKHGHDGSSYNIGGENEWENIRLVETLCGIVAQLIGTPAGELAKLITFVADRPGHDRRYSIDCDKIKKELGWKRKWSFEDGLKETARWYVKRNKEDRMALFADSDEKRT